ncbi:MAG: CoA-binding protein [bacterium]|nr:CoA-binding protein [bacterium]
MNTQAKATIVVGASDKEDRYSNKAIRMLGEYGHPVVGVHPKLVAVGEVKVLPDLESAQQFLGKVDTVTLYVGAAKSSSLLDELLALRPRRVVFNPGAENQELFTVLRANGIEVLEACTLVLLRTGAY